MVLAFFCLVTSMTFVTFAIDVGMIALTKQRMQNAVDAAAMAAIMEINSALAHAGPDVVDFTQYAEDAARAVAATVAGMNGVHIDPATDVQFGRRTYDAGTDRFSVEWNVSPSNVVKVIARKDNADETAPDARLPALFARVWGNDGTDLRAEASAYVEARDIVAAIDFSGSMSHYSQFKPQTLDELGQVALEGNLYDIYSSLQPLDLGSLSFTPTPLLVYSPPGDVDDPVVTVSFLNTHVVVDSSLPYEEVELIFSDGAAQEFTSLNESSGEYSGSGDHEDKNVETVWVRFPGDDVTVSGQDAAGCRPHIEVTFNASGTSVEIVSTKDLSNVVLEFEDGSHYKFDNLNQGPTGTFQGLGEHAGKTIVGVWVKSGCNQSGDGPGYGERFNAPDNLSGAVAYRFDDNNENVLAYFELSNVPYPYPSGSWDDFIDYVRADSDIDRAGYRELYGGLTFVHYLLERQPHAHQTPELWRTPHYPFHAVKTGVSELADYVADLGFGDHLGLVSYDSTRRTETLVNDGQTFVDITSQPITDDYAAIQTIIEHRQAAHYASATNIGGGLVQALELLDSSGRSEARPTILLMTDGHPNIYDSFNVPEDWNWDELTDFDNDGAADYVLTESSSQYAAKMYTLVKAKEARDAGVTVHTLTVGDGADQELMHAVAQIGAGLTTHVPSGLSQEDLQAAVSEAFRRLTAYVPPPKLLSGE
jgi:hypothetical protein